MSRFRTLAVVAASATYLLIVAGAIVRVSGSGLGCPDWPLCHGQWIPPLELTAIIEYSHRLLGAIVSALLMAVCVTAWISRRGQRAVLVPATLMPIVLAIQIGLGAVVVRLELPAMVVLVHLGFAMVILALQTWIAVWAGPPPLVLQAGGANRGVSKGVNRLIVLSMALVFFLILSGAFVRATGASWACVGFPTCNGEALPFGTSRLVDIQLLHRLLAYAGAWCLGLCLYQIVRRCRAVPALKRTSQAAVALVVVQIGLGALAVLYGVPPLVQALHVAGATAVWAAVVVMTALSGRVGSPPASSLPSGGDLSPAEPVATRRSVVGAYVQLTKPRVMVLLLITTLAAMMVASAGLPALSLVFFTLLGGALASGGASAINHYLDRDIDHLMGRTNLRPVVTGAVTPAQALRFGVGLGVASFVIMTVFVNLLAALLSLGALLFYVFVYTRWLKRSTPSNIVIGGAAGAIPPLVGVAAVTGEVNLLGLYLFAIVFFWTPPHFWALALLLRQEYERARVPMLPIVRGEEETRRQIVLYSLQLVALTGLLFSFQLMGRFYLVSALLLGGLFLYFAVKLWRDASAGSARRLFTYSIVYLTLLFTAMVVDRQLIL